MVGIKDAIIGSAFFVTFLNFLWLFYALLNNDFESQIKAMLWIILCFGALNYLSDKN